MNAVQKAEPYTYYRKTGDKSLKIILSEGLVEMIKFHFPKIDIESRLKKYGGDLFPLLKEHEQVVLSFETYQMNDFVSGRFKKDWQLYVVYRNINNHVIRSSMSH